MDRLRTLPASVQSLALILYPVTVDRGEPWTRSRDTYDALQAGLYTAGETRALRDKMLWSFLRMALNGQAQNMLVAGLEAVKLGPEVISLEERVEELKAELKNMSLDIKRCNFEWRLTWTADQVDSRVEAIRFVSLEEYQEGEDDDVF